MLTFSELTSIDTISNHKSQYHSYFFRLPSFFLFIYIYIYYLYIYLIINKL